MTKRSRSQCISKVKLYLRVQSTAIFHNLACAERFFDAFFVVVSMKGGQSKLGRLEKLRIKNFCWSPIGRIKSLHVVTSDYCFAHIQKWKCSGLITLRWLKILIFPREAWAPACTSAWGITQSPKESRDNKTNMAARGLPFKTLFPPSF